ncbi:MAG: ArdC family protein [Patescibacteria group bacterium]
MKTNVDACLKELAAWYARNRREMLQPEFDAILAKHCQSEAEMANFAKFLNSQPGEEKFKTLLKTAMEERPGQTDYVWVSPLGVPAERFETPLAAGFYIGRWAARELGQAYGSYQRQWFSEWTTPSEIRLADHVSLIVTWGDAGMIPIRDLTRQEQDLLEEGISRGWDFGPLEPSPQSLKTKYEGQKVTLNGKPAIVKSAMGGEVAVIQSDTESAETSWAKLHDLMIHGKRDFVSSRGVIESAQNVKKEVSPAQSLNPEELQSLIEGLPDLLDDSKKAASIKRLKKALADIGKNLEGLDEVMNAINDYERITREGMTPEEYQDEKEAAFDAIRDALEELEVIEPDEKSPQMVEVWYWKDSRYMLGAVPTPEEQKRDYAVMWRGTQTGSPLEVAERMFMELNQRPEAYFSQADVKQKLQPHPHTSMSIGDIVVVNGQKFLCQSAEWKAMGSKPSLLYEPEPCEIVPPQYYDVLPLLDSVPMTSLLLEPSAKERKIDEALRRLKEGVESIQSSSVFREFLLTMSKFHQYSIGNQILIMLQRPGAKHVAGFNTWKDLGRSVMAGEKGIMILAPCVGAPKFTCPLCKEGPMTETALRKHLQSAHPAADLVTELRKARFDAEEELATYFKVLYVFDISQTQGKPLPEVEVPALTGAANEELSAKALAHCQGQGLTVSFDSRPGQDPDIKGEYFARTIWVRPEESRAQQLKTLLHEIAHYYSESVFGIPRSDAETIAESSAFVVGAHFGFDSGLRSFPYVAVWSQDKKVLDKNLLAIRNVAAKMIQALEGSK